MKRSPFLVSLLFLFALPALAQESVSYRFDNFDFANGVRVQAPQRPSAKGRRLTRSTSWKYSSANASLNEITNMQVSNSLGGFSTGNPEVDSFIVESGTRNSVDPLLLYSIMHQESTFKPHAMSYKGARGLMQLMPATAVRFGVGSIWDPKQNIEGGARYMRFLLDLFDGNVTLALAGYNAGEGAVMKYGYRVPPYSETQEYVRRIGHRYSVIRDPLAAERANFMSRSQLASVQQKESKPLTIYERSVFAVRLPDGSLQLVSQ